MRISPRPMLPVGGGLASSSVGLVLSRPPNSGAQVLVFRLVTTVHYGQWRGDSEVR